MSDQLSPEASADGAAGSEKEVVVPDLEPTPEYDTELSLPAREQKWGFSLGDLRSACRVVRTLFLNPALFVGDPYLSDSRLYTMITRDRQKKKDNRDVLKAIMSEEKSRRKKYQRSQNRAAVGLTIMKRERQDALGSLMLAPAAGESPLLLLDNATPAAEADAIEDSVEECASPADATEAGAASGELSPNEKAVLRLVAAFEAVLRLQRCLAGREHFESTFSCDSPGAAGTTAAAAAPKREEASLEEASSMPMTTGKDASGSKVAVDWDAASQLTAQVYRFMPPPVGSQMPSPLFEGAIPRAATASMRLRYVLGLKLEIARQAAQLCGSTKGMTGGQEEGQPQPTKRAKNEDDKSTSGGAALAMLLREGAAAGEILADVDGPRDGPASEAAWAFTHISALRALVAASDLSAPAASAGELASLPGRRYVPTVDGASLLDVLETVLVHGATSVEGECELWPTPRAAAVSAECTLNLFIARRLYGCQKIRDFGESPVVVERHPPTSESVEPEGWNVFDDLQLYATDHHDGDGLRLTKWRGCNICKVRFDRLHPYYYSMCHLCGEFNYNKRLVTRDLRGKVVLLTGCRIKIGFAMALSLLRCGAIVLGTTRFAHEAIARFQQESDYDLWKDNLHLYSLDLRDLWVVTQFCAFVQLRFPKVFAIMNNAAQTIARTPQYTEHLRRIEIAPSPELRTALAHDSTATEWHQFFLRHTTVTVGQALSIEHQPTTQPFLPAGPSDTAGVAEGGHAAQAAHDASSQRDHTTPSASSAMTLPVAPATKPSGIVDHIGAHKDAGAMLVFDRYDTQAEESDHRETNSWVMNLAEVQGSEAAEVMAINALSPFIINSKLKPCLTNRTGDAVPNEPRFIINVSAMEGQFYRFKQTTHPHTNMAKAALNMMTRTSAEDYAQEGIYMNSVDTGWITDESPKMKKERRAEQYMLCPLDEVDAAARCLDLIYTDSKVYGHFYKDFKSIPW